MHLHVNCIPTAIYCPAYDWMLVAALDETPDSQPFLKGKDDPFASQRQMEPLSSAIAHWRAISSSQSYVWHCAVSKHRVMSKDKDKEIVPADRHGCPLLF